MALANFSRADEGCTVFMALEQCVVVLPTFFLSNFLWYDFVLFDFWHMLTTVLNVLKNKGVIFIFFPFFLLNYLLSFLLQELLLIYFCY